MTSTESTSADAWLASLPAEARGAVEKARRQLLDQALGPADPAPARPRLPPSVHRRLGEAASGAAAVSMTSLARRPPLLLALPDAWLAMLRQTPQGVGMQQQQPPAADAPGAVRLVKVPCLGPDVEPLPAAAWCGCLGLGAVAAFAA